MLNTRMIGWNTYGLRLCCYHVSDHSLCLQVHDVRANSLLHFSDGCPCGSPRGVLLYGREDAGWDWRCDLETTVAALGLSIL
jgi:hypothetical protein